MSTRKERRKAVCSAQQGMLVASVWVWGRGPNTPYHYILYIPDPSYGRIWDVYPTLIIKPKVCFRFVRKDHIKCWQTYFFGFIFVFCKEKITFSFLLIF